MLFLDIQADLNEAIKARDQNKVDTLRFLLGELKNLRIAKYPQGDDSNLTDEDVLGVLGRQVKTHKESIEMFEKGNRADLVARERAQLIILQSYLPAQMTEEEVRQKIVVLRANNPETDFGAMMKIVMGDLKGKADGGTVSKILKEVLESK